MMANVEGLLCPNSNRNPPTALGLANTPVKLTCNCKLLYCAEAKQKHPSPRLPLVHASAQNPRINLQLPTVSYAQLGFLPAPPDLEGSAQIRAGLDRSCMHLPASPMLSAATAFPYYGFHRSWSSQVSRKLSALWNLNVAMSD